MKEESNQRRRVLHNDIVSAIISSKIIAAIPTGPNSRRRKAFVFKPSKMIVQRLAKKLSVYRHTTVTELTSTQFGNSPNDAHQLEICNMSCCRFDPASRRLNLF